MDHTRRNDQMLGCRFWANYRCNRSFIAGEWVGLQFWFENKAPPFALHTCSALKKITVSNIFILGLTQDNDSKSLWVQDFKHHTWITSLRLTSPGMTIPCLIFLKIITLSAELTMRPLLSFVCILIMYSLSKSWKIEPLNLSACCKWIDCVFFQLYLVRLNINHDWTRNCIHMDVQFFPVQPVNHST